MIVGVGTDLVEIVRLEEAIARTPTLRERLFTPEERRLDMDSLAADDGGRPRLELRGSVAEAVAALGAVRVHLSLSHDGGFAQAFVILES